MTKQKLFEEKSLNVIEIEQANWCAVLMVYMMDILGVYIKTMLYTKRENTREYNLDCISGLYTKAPGTGDIKEYY